MKKYFLLFFLMVSASLFAAQVVKVSKSKRDMAITHEMGSEWKVGQRFCVKNQAGKSFCGQVTKVKSAGAICKMDSPVDGVVSGDEVTREDSLGGASGELQSGLSSGLEAAPEQSSKKRTAQQRGMGIGLRGGLVLGNVSTNVEADYDNRKGIHLGVFSDIALGEGLLSLEPGLAFVQKGFETASYGNKLNYLDLSLLFKIRFIQGPFTPIAAAGPYLSYLLSAKYTSAIVQTDIKSQYKTIDFGLLGMLGFEFKASSKLSLGLLGAYGLGLTNIDADSNTSTKNKTIQFLGVVKFDVN